MCESDTWWYEPKLYLSHVAEHEMHCILNSLLATGAWASCQIRKQRVVHAPGMPGTFSQPPQYSDPDMHHGTCVTHVPWCMPGSLISGFLWSWWRRKRSRHSRRMRNPQFYVSGKRPMWLVDTALCQCLEEVWIQWFRGSVIFCFLHWIKTIGGGLGKGSPPILKQYINSKKNIVITWQDPEPELPICIGPVEKYLLSICRRTVDHFLLWYHPVISTPYSIWLHWNWAEVFGSLLYWPNLG